MARKSRRGVDDVVYEGDEPHLRGSDCPSCSEVSFPFRDRCTACGSETESLLFDRTTELETYSTVHVGPPQFETPYSVGYVRLRPGPVRAFTPLDGDPDAFEIGMTVAVDTMEIGGRETWGCVPEGER